MDGASGGSTPIGGGAQSMYPAVCPGHQKAVTEIHYAGPTPDGCFFISACLDKLPMLRDGVTGDWIGTFTGHKGAVWSAKLTADASRAATGSADFSVKVWDSSGSVVASLDMPHVVKSVDFSPASAGAPSGARLATGGHFKKLIIFDLNARPAPVPVAELAHPERIRRVLWSPDGRRVVTGSEDGGLRMWDLAAGACVREVAAAPGVAGGVSDVELSRDGRTLTVAAGREIQFYDADSLALLRRLPLGFQVECVSRHASGSHVVCGGTDVWVRLLDANTGAEVACQKGHHGTVHCTRFAPDGATYSSGADDATIRIWPFEPHGKQSPVGGSGGGGGGPVG